MSRLSSFRATPATASRAGSLSLVGGALALDFANTCSGRGGPEFQEHFTSAGDVLDWGEHAGVMEAGEARILRDAIEGDPALAAAFLERTLQARELVHDIEARVAASRPVEPGLAEALTALHAASLSCATLELRGGAYGWTWSARRDPVGAFLGPILWSALSLLTATDLTRTKRCEGPGCGWLFLDTTKNNTRRWCDMKVCGNRAKVTAHRARQRGQHQA